MSAPEREKGKYMKEWILAVVGIVGGYIASLFGGWSASLITLVTLMGVDYVTGLIVAALFHASPKTPDGRLESFAGWKGLCRKGVTLAIVWVAKRLDLTVGSDFIGDAVIIAYIANEAISIIENAGRMGVPIPEVVVNAIEVLKKDKDKEQGK